jgi:tetratricopeptide (TPR) repeat protein
MQYRSPFRAACIVLFAVLTLSEAIGQNPPLAEAKRLFAAGSYVRACRLLESSLKIHPQDFEAHLLLGQIYTIQGRRSEAIQQLTKAVELNPDSANAYNMLGTALNRFAEFEQAREAFTQAVARDPKFPQARINLAMSLAEGNDTTRAAEQLHTAIDLAPTAPTAATAHYLLAKIYQDQDTNRAIDELEQGVRIEPCDQEAWLVLGELRSDSNDEPAALTAFQRAAKCNPRDADAQYQLGSEYLNQGQAKQAVLHLELARKLMPNPSIALLYKLDRALRKNGDTAEASRVRQQAQALLAQDTRANEHFQQAQTLDREGVELEGKGETQSALEKYRAALELNPQQNGFRLNYALALCRLNRWQEGIAELNDILERDPGNIEARRALFIAEDKAKQTPDAQPDPR